MDFITIVSALLRLVGLAEWFEGWMKRRATAKQAQAVANSPTTDEEWTDAAKDSDL